MKLEKLKKDAAGEIYTDHDQGETMTSWEKKAHALIGVYARESYTRANKGRKRTVPYTLPEIADALVKALGIHDHKAREAEIKRLFEVERLGAWALI